MNSLYKYLAIKRTVLFLLYSLSADYSLAQLSPQTKDSLDKINHFLDELPQSRRLSNYIKYRVQYDNDDEVKVFTEYFGITTNIKANQYNVATFHLSDIDPKAILIRPYNQKEVMIQLIVKGNLHNVKSVFYMNDQEISSSDLDRESFDSFDPKICRQTLNRIRDLFVYVVSSCQKDIHENNVTDTTDIKTVINNTNKKQTVVDLGKKNKGEAYVFGLMEKSPTFQNSKSTKETELNARNYLLKSAKDCHSKSHGRVFLTFNIDENGRTSNVVILKGVNKELDDLSIKLVLGMPSWTPGSDKGINVVTKFSTNIEF